MGGWPLAPHQAPLLDRLPSHRASDIKLPGLDPGLCLRGTPHFQEVMPLLKNLLGSPLGGQELPGLLLARLSGCRGDGGEPVV